MVSRHSLRAVRRAMPGLVALGACIALTGFALRGTTPLVADGIYTKQQAERGRESYDKSCSECHGAKLEGGTSTPLAGEEFTASWAKPYLTLDDFYYIVRKTMPKETPGSLERETYADIVAYVLQQNGFPHGEKEFSADTALMKTIRFGATTPPALSASGSPNLGPR